MSIQPSYMYILHMGCRLQETKKMVIKHVKCPDYLHSKNVLVQMKLDEKCCLNYSFRMMIHRTCRISKHFRPKRLT